MGDEFHPKNHATSRALLHTGVRESFAVQIDVGACLQQTLDHGFLLLEGGSGAEDLEGGAPVVVQLVRVGPVLQQH